VRARRIDANQNEVVDALRKIGASVRVTSSLGNGFPDLAVGFAGKTVLMELKDGSKPPSAQALTEEEAAFFDTWRGSAVVVRSAEEAVEYMKWDVYE
jgi:hypothetical protein